MQFAIEAPFPLQEMLIPETDYDYLLAHLVMEDKSYVDFYQKQKESGRFSILDNSVFELGEAVSDEMLIECLEVTGADELIVPDSINNAEKTVEKVDKFLQHYDYITELGAQLHAVAQGNTLQKFLECFRYLSDNPKIKVIGIPFEVEFEGMYDDFPKDERLALTRLAVTNLIDSKKLYSTDKEYHLLGASLPFELVFQKHYKWIRSCDTSAPVMAGITNTPVFGAITKYHRIKDYFNYGKEINTAQLKSMYKALEDFKEGITL